MKRTVKITITIELDPTSVGRGISKFYRIEKWIYDRKTGLTLEHGNYGTGYTLKEAREAKRRILRDYFG